MNQYGEKIAALRKAKGMTQAELGKEMSVTFQAVSKWERGESLPDLETLSRIAKLFEVPLSYFEEGGEVQETVPSHREESAERKMLGICISCGKVMYEGDEAETDPALVCKTCSERKAAEEKRRAREQKEKQEALARQREQAAKDARDRDKAKNVSYCNRGLIWGAVIVVPFVILWLIMAILHPADSGSYLITFAFTVVCIYPFVVQLFWDGFIREVTLTGGKIVGTPGVIFSLDLDGIIFLIVVKILFALLRMTIYVLTLLFFVVVAMLLAPIALAPQLIKCRRGDL